MKLYRIVIIALMATVFTACEDKLDEEVFSELSPSNLLNNEKGLSFLLNSAYTYGHRVGAVSSWAPYHMSSMTAGETWGVGGSIENLWVAEMDFTWDSNHAHFLSVWQVHYNSIRDANLVLDNLDNENLSEDFKQLTKAEAHFLRGWNYAALYNWFGGVPLYTSSEDELLQPRATAEETRTLIEQELTLAANGLPKDEPQFGRASKGTALAVLCKFYLNTKQWQKAADAAQDVIDLQKYDLLGDYGDIFAYDNEGNQELIWVLPKDGATLTDTGQGLNALTFPPDFPMPFSNNSVFAARTYLFDDFVNSFEETDTRQNQIITEWTSTNTGELVTGLGNDQSFPYKLPFEPNSVGAWAGNDLPVIRYADILLSRAEALNEISGPTQEIIDLINDVRERAEATPYTLAGFTKESLRDAILQEREWEFYWEEKAREDQIRHGVFISRAQARGKNAQDYHVLFPIPQVELDANPNLEQNPGY
ncbi:RagB/SusD family nutrient uptake outer membrane protein [Muricauda sp. TY007]|uniref:RagB/SusD family nutrient uptake outer membrane protein n=1 Tax=Allomuricauda sp. TY007 TaxID=2683200 RepID=UPI0013C103DC|nr:RagB/SusD family nutrient uptake outer membrane protein [Muricauda sp. TY007]NDV16208.1 RagB/SusD family nutrient uptake outer membrane protein [Muricauda sp. TY007]